MGVFEAHGSSIEQINCYNYIYTLDDFSIAEYHKAGDKTIQGFSHSHEEYEFMIPIKTIPILVYDKANYIGEVGFIYPVNPYTVHGIEFPLEESHCLDITVSLSLVERIKKEMGYEGKYFYTRFLRTPELINYINMYVDTFKNRRSDELKLDSMKNLIVHTLVENGLETGEDNRRPEKQYRKSVRSIIIYMFDHFREKELNIEKLSEISGFSPAYFSKSFKAYMGDTPIMHLNKLRISEAKYLMSTTDDRLQDIADKVGYNNFSTFTEAFKTITGYTPTEYKREFLKKEW